MSEVDTLTRIIDNLYTAVFQRGTGGKKFNAVLRNSQLTKEDIFLTETAVAIDVNSIPRSRYGGDLVVAGSDTDAGASQYGITGATQRLQFNSGALYDSVKEDRVGWCVVRLKINWAATASGTDPTVLYWFSGASAYLWLAFNDATDQWKIERKNAIGTSTIVGAVATHTAGTDHTIAFWWNDTQGAIGIDNVASATVSSLFNYTAMTANSFDIGTKGGANINPINASVYWMVMGTGVLTDAARLTYHGFGNTDPTDWSSLPDFSTSAPSFLWRGVSATVDPYVNYGEGVYAG